MNRVFIWVRKWIGKSVFVPLPKASSMESMLATYFHRASSTIYLVYTLWSITSVIYGIPSLIMANGEQWQILFSISVLLFTAPATFGATFWPSFARLEAFAGSGFVGLMLLYEGFLVNNALKDLGPASWSAPVLIFSIFIIPLCRVIIVFVFLTRQAAERRAAYQAYLEAHAANPSEE